MVLKILWLVLLVGGASVGNAQPILVQNHDFEDPVLAADAFTTGTLPGWTGGGGNWGTFYPTIATWGYEAPSGNQLLYANATTVEQVLAETVVEGGRYALRVDVVNRPVYGSPDYQIELWAGTTLLASDDASLTPPLGGSLVSRLVATVGAGSPAIGQPLIIRFGGGNQVNFDNVRLLPEPGSASGLVAVALLASLASRRARVRSGGRGGGIRTHGWEKKRSHDRSLELRIVGQLQNSYSSLSNAASGKPGAVQIDGSRRLSIGVERGVRAHSGCLPRRPNACDPESSGSPRPARGRWFRSESP